jgi:hypothetical protein
MNIDGRQALPSDGGLTPSTPTEELTTELTWVCETLANLAQIPRQAKVYPDSGGKMQVSGGALVKWAVGDKGNGSDSSWWKSVAKTAQAVSRAFYGQNQQEMIEHLRKTKLDIVATCHLIDQQVALKRVNDNQELTAIRSQVIEAQSRANEAAQRGLRNLIETYLTQSVPSKDISIAETKAGKIQAAVQSFEYDVRNALAASLNKLEASLASPEASFLSEPTSASSLLLPEETTPTVSTSSVPLGLEPTGLAVEGALPQPSATTSSSTDLAKASASAATDAAVLTTLPERSLAPPSVPTPTVPAPTQPAVPLSVGTVVREDTTVSIDISALMVQALQMPQLSTFQQAKREQFLEEFKIQDISLRDIFNSLSPEGKIALQEYVVGYWWQRTYPGQKREPKSQARLDAIAKRLAPIKLKGLSLSDALDREPTRNIVLLKDELVKYRYTFLVSR